MLSKRLAVICQKLRKAGKMIYIRMSPRIDKAIEANQVVKSSESQGDSSKEKGKSQTSMILFLVGVAVTLSISTIYFTKQGKKAGK